MASLQQRKRSLADINRTGKGQGKLSVAEPTSFKKFFIILSMHMFRKILVVDTGFKVAIYIIGVAVGSLITDIVPIPRTYFSNTKNPINVYLVKLGWGWTCSVLIMFVYMTSFTYCLGNLSLVKRHLSRCGIATVLWYACTTLFDRIDNSTGSCSIENLNDKLSCIKEEGSWVSFDISGHAFLLIHCLLTISEEVKCIQGWDRIDEMIADEDENPSGRLSAQELGILIDSYKRFTPFIRVLTCILAILQIIWEIMLLATIVYFHNMPQKVTGALFAIVCWFVTYQIWYKTESEWCPGEVGDGPVKYQKYAPVRR